MSHNSKHSLSAHTQGILVGLCLALMPFNQVAAVEIRGARSCGTWIKDRNDKAFSTLASEAWLVGFLSGKASADQKDVLKGTDNDSLYLWMDNYCLKNALNFIYDGAQELYEELKRTKGTR